MRYIRIRKAVEDGSFKNVVFRHQTETNPVIAAMANPKSQKLAVAKDTALSGNKPGESLESDSDNALPVLGHSNILRRTQKVNSGLTESASRVDKPSTSNSNRKRKTFDEDESLFFEDTSTATKRIKCVKTGDDNTKSATNRTDVDIIHDNIADTDSLTDDDDVNSSKFRMTIRQKYDEYNKARKNAVPESIKTTTVSKTNSPATTLDNKAAKSQSSRMTLSQNPHNKPQKLNPPSSVFSNFKPAYTTHPSSPFAPRGKTSKSHPNVQKPVRKVTRTEPFNPSVHSQFPIVTALPQPHSRLDNTGDSNSNRPRRESANKVQQISKESSKSQHAEQRKKGERVKKK